MIERSFSGNIHRSFNMPLPALAIPILAAVAGGVASAGASKFFSGSPEQHERVGTLRPDQEPLYKQLQAALQKKGAGGAFGQSADYYRDLLSDNPETMQQFSAPELRRFNEEIIPDLSEQFAGMGSGGLSSSGFRNAAVNAGTDLSERLGAIRAQLRQQGAQGLANLGQVGLGNYSQDVMTQPGSEGFLSAAAPGIARAATSAAADYFNRPQASSNTPMNNSASMKGTSSPYGGSNFRDVNFMNQ